MGGGGGLQGRGRGRPPSCRPAVLVTETPALTCLPLRLALSSRYRQSTRSHTSTCWEHRRLPVMLALARRAFHTMLLCGQPLGSPREAKAASAPSSVRSELLDAQAQGTPLKHLPQRRKTRKIRRLGRSLLCLAGCAHFRNHMELNPPDPGYAQGSPGKQNQ